MSVEQWKLKYLYPFGNIAPIGEAPTNTAEADSFNPAAFESLVNKKYRFPLEKVHKPQWLKELQRPIQVTAEDIIRDLYKFVKDFPIEIIPHMTEDEMLARKKEREEKPNNFDVFMGTKVRF